MTQTLEIKKSKARSITAVVLMFLSAAMLTGIALEPKFRERPNIIAAAVGLVCLFLFFYSCYYAAIYSFADALGSYAFDPYYLVHRKTFGGGHKDTVVEYSQVTKIRARVPLWGNFPKNYYANIRITKMDGKTIELESVPNWEEVLIYLLESVSSSRKIPVYQILADQQTEIAYSVAAKKLSLPEKS